MGTVAEQRAGRSDERAAVLGALGQRVAPMVMAHTRTLPVPAELDELFVEGGLVRGRVLSCRGAAATSTALALLAPAARAGAWLAVVDVPTIGLDAASEIGIPLERVVGIELGERPAELWPDVVAAAADGFELVLTRVPEGVRPAVARSVATRLHQRGVVLVVLGDPGPLASDAVLETTGRDWCGLGDGFGHLRRRTVEVVATGRRVPQVRRCTMPFPPGGRTGDDRPAAGPELVAV